MYGVRGRAVRVISGAASSMSAKTERVWPESAVTRPLQQRWIGGAGGGGPSRCIAPIKINGRALNVTVVYKRLGVEVDRNKAKQRRETVICLMETLHPSPPAPPTFTANIKVLPPTIFLRCFVFHCWPRLSLYKGKCTPFASFGVSAVQCAATSICR